MQTGTYVNELLGIINFFVQAFEDQSTNEVIYDESLTNTAFPDIGYVMIHAEILIICWSLGQ